MAEGELDQADDSSQLSTSVEWGGYDQPGKEESPGGLDEL